MLGSPIDASTLTYPVGLKATLYIDSNTQYPMLVVESRMLHLGSTSAFSETDERQGTTQKLSRPFTTAGTFRSSSAFDCRFDGSQP